jgi:CheY-like chemotaxis protein
MAKGLAHDFNNLLLGIMSSTHTATQSLPEGSPAHAPLARVTQTIQKANRLTEQMLTYAGIGHEEVESSDLNELIRTMLGLLKASLSKKTRLTLELEVSLSQVDINLGQIRQVLLALVQNAATSVGEHRGEVVLRTREVDSDEALLGAEVFTNRLPQGPAILFELSDTGKGIERQHRSRIFDPFFRDSGETGLGLASVLGIVRSHRGALALRAQPGAGTTVQILFPLSIQFTQSAACRASQPWRGQGTILVVDDEEFVRESTREVLELMGFVTWVAVDGEQAMSIFESSRDRLNALILDWNMPGLNGLEVLNRIRNIDPEISVIFTSANRPDQQILNLREDAHLIFLRKPYTLDALRAALQHSLTREQSA